MTEPSMITGQVQSVQVVPLGDELATAASTGATSVTVDNPVDFDPDGGTVSINGVQYAYTAVDEDSGAITLSSGLTAGAAQGDRVDVWDSVVAGPAVEYRALVVTPGDLNGGDPIDAVVSSAVAVLLPEGIRDPGTGETVTCEMVAGEWTVTDIRGRLPQVQGGLIKAGSIAEEALGFTLPDGTQVTVSATAPSAPADGDWWVDSSSDNKISRWDAGTPAWVAVQFGTQALVAGSITADLLAADSIIAGKIAAGALDAYSISSVSLSSATISGHVIGSVLTGSDFVVDSDDGRIFVYSQVATVDLFTSSPGSGSYTVPAGVTSVRVEAWGGGGAGAHGTNVFGAGGGGGGGEYACEPTWTVTPGDTINYTVGAATSTSSLSAGGNSVTAHGGQDALTSGTAGAGGTGSTNTIHFDGGRGGSGNGGGGGSSAGTAHAGQVGGTGTANGAAGGIAPSGGGDGGAGGNSSTLTNGTAGSTPGGGGGAGASNGASTTSGGPGAPGQVRITRYTTTPVASIAVSAGTDRYGNSYPAGVSIYGIPITDWNSATQPGIYAGAGGTTNAPTSAGYVGWTLGEFGDANGAVTQIVTRVTTIDAPELWVRTYSTINGWQPWHKIYDANTPKVITSSTSITPSAVNTPTSQSVSFPAGSFSSAPLVFLQITTGVSGTTTCFVWPATITSSGFTLNINRSSTTPTGVQWMAVGT